MAEYKGYDIPEGTSPNKQAVIKALIDKEESGGGGGGWHIDAICYKIDFTPDEANIIKSQLGRIIQRWFGGNPIANTPVQYAEAPQSPMRHGDPSGLIGVGFSLCRRVYYALEHVPLVNNLRFWATIDQFILRNCEDETANKYITAIQRQNSSLVEKQS